MSRLEEIRTKLKIYKGSDADLKHELIQWLTGVPKQRYHIALTLQPTKVPYLHKSLRYGLKGRMAYRCKGREQILQDGRKFVRILNKKVCGNAYKRFKTRLDLVMVLEGKKSNVDPHLHLAIGVPKNRNIKKVAQCIEKAIRLSGEFQIENPLYKPTHTASSSEEKFRYKIALINDEGWIKYITKELEPDRNEEINLEFPV